MASETEPNYYYPHSRNFSSFSAIRLWLLPALWSRGSQSPRNKSVPRPHWLALSRIAYPDQLQRSRPREGNSIGSMPCPSKQLRLQLPIRLEGGQSAPPRWGWERPRQSPAVLPTFSLCFQSGYGSHSCTIDSQSTGTPASCAPVPAISVLP